MSLSAIKKSNLRTSIHVIRIIVSTLLTSQRKIERHVPNFQIASIGSSSETVVLVDMV